MTSTPESADSTQAVPQEKSDSPPVKEPAHEPEDVPIPEVEQSLAEGRYDMEFPYVPLDAMNPAPYNPRKMTPEALSALAASLDEHGLVQPLIWNKKTGNLVGGHQRYRILRQRSVKEVKTCVVDLDEVDEKALNITLNNPEVQGTFDGATLRKLLGSIKNAKTKNQYKRSGLEALENQIDLFDGGVKKPDLKQEPAAEPDTRDLSYIAPSLRLLAVPINSLKQDPNNVRTHDERNRLAVRNSLARFGQIRPIVTYRKVVVAGNCTWEEMKALGRDHVAAMPADHLSVGEIVAYGLVDNKSAQLAGTDEKKLSTVLKALNDGWQELLPFTGFQGYESQAAIAGNHQPIPLTQTLQVEKIKPHPKNYRQHPDNQMTALIESVKIHGMYRAIVVAKDNTILAGHGIFQAACAAGLSEVPIIRLDIEPEDSRALKILAGDNEVGHFSDQDDRQLTEILKTIVETSGDLTGTGYDKQKLAALVFTTRPASEFSTMDEAAHWVGMPDFESSERPLHLMVNFADEAARTEFFALLGMDELPFKSDSRQPSIWWPLKTRRDLKSIRFDAKKEETAS